MIKQPDLLEFKLPDEANGQQSLPFKLSGSQRKTAFALRMNAQKMIAEAPGGLGSIGFATFTVGDENPDTGRFEPLLDRDEANRRWNNLNRHVISRIFSKCIVVTERSPAPKNYLHFHVLGVMIGDIDIRTGLDFDAVRRRDYRSVSPALRSIWEDLRDTLPDYGFGRAEVLPVKKTGDAVASYVSKYIEKNICNRLKSDFRKKLVRYIGFKKTQLKPNEFEWNGERAVAWRAKARALFDVAGCKLPDRDVPIPASFEGISREGRDMIRPKQFDGTEAKNKFGPRWAFMATGIWTDIFGDDLHPGLVFTPGKYCATLRELDYAQRRWEKLMIGGFRAWKNDQADEFHHGQSGEYDFYQGRIDFSPAEWQDFLNPVPNPAVN